MLKAEHPTQEHQLSELSLFSTSFAPASDGPWRRASRSPAASPLFISFCLAVHFFSCCREGRQPVFSVQRWLLMFPQDAEMSLLLQTAQLGTGTQHMKEPEHGV